jgi:glyceraldehyde 3-phosphate dehydrogenase
MTERTMITRKALDDTLRQWIDREGAVEAMVPLVGALYRRRNVVAKIFGRGMPNRSAGELLKLHRFSRHLLCEELAPEETLAVLQTLVTLDLAPTAVDVGELSRRFRDVESMSLESYLRSELATVIGARASAVEPTDVVLYGFGRIGRLVARILLARAGGASGLRLRAIVVRGGGPDDLVKRASLLRRDSVHGPFDGSITVDHAVNAIVANGTVIEVINAADPSEVDYAARGIRNAILVDNTGRWRDRAGLERHIRNPGISKVLLTAPGKGDLPNIVHGINHDLLAAERIVAAASCTTNAVTPVLVAIDREYGIDSGHIETVHSFTNDQNLTDNIHPGDRRGRSAPLNLVLAETGAAQAVAKAYPPLAGKLSGSAIRVPTPDVSIAVLNLRLHRPAAKQELNRYLRGISLWSDLHQQVDYLESPEIVSSDILGNRKAGVVDGLATIANGTESVVVYVWYDNEYGYSRQVVRVLETMTGVRLRALPAIDVGLLEAAEARVRLR